MLGAGVKYAAVVHSYRPYHFMVFVFFCCNQTSSVLLYLVIFFVLSMDMKCVDFMIAWMLSIPWSVDGYIINGIATSAALLILLYL